MSRPRVAGGPIRVAPLIIRENALCRWYHQGSGAKRKEAEVQTSLLISSGEFARMCNVSRELLIHYDKIGLLKPKEVRENGYRYYSLRQLYLFDVIRFFSDTGMSMKEIKQYLDNRDDAAVPRLRPGEHREDGAPARRVGRAHLHDGEDALHHASAP